MLFETKIPGTCEGLGFMYPSVVNVVESDRRNSIGLCCFFFCGGGGDLSALTARQSREIDDAFFARLLNIM